MKSYYFYYTNMDNFYLKIIIQKKKINFYIKKFK
jgi:hypothetical protein